MGKDTSWAAPGAADLMAAVRKEWAETAGKQLDELRKGLAEVKTGPGRPTIDGVMAGLSPGTAVYYSTAGGPLAAGVVSTRKRFAKHVGVQKGYHPDPDRAARGEQVVADFGKDYLKNLFAVHPKQTERRRPVEPAQYDAAMARLYELGVKQVFHHPNGDVTYAPLEKAAMNESSGVAGGYTVPPYFYEELLRYAVEESVLWGKCRTLPMAGRTLQVPVLDQATSQGTGASSFLAGMQAAWESEAQLLAEYEPIFRQLELTAWTLGLISIASDQVLQDNAVGLDGLMTELLTAVIGWTADYAFVQGNGVGKPLGIVNAPATIAVSREIGGRFTWRDARAMLKKIYAGLYKSNQVWLMNQGMYDDLLGMNDESGSGANTGRVLFVPYDQGARGRPPAGGSPWAVGTLLGREVFVTEKCSAPGTLGDVLLVDTQSYIAGDRMELEIEISPHYKFANYQIVWRAVARLDGQPFLSGPITLADGTTKVSSFVALQ